MKFELELNNEEELKKLYLILLFYQQYLWPKMYERKRTINEILQNNSQIDKSTLSFLDYQRIELLIETEHDQLCDELCKQIKPFIAYPLIDIQYYQQIIKKEGE